MSEDKNKEKDNLEPQDNSEKKDTPNSLNNEVSGEQGSLPDKEKEVPEKDVHQNEKKPEINSENSGENLNTGDAEQPDKENLQEKPVEIESSKVLKKKPSESNYQVSLVNENLLRIKINTERGVDITCSTDKTAQGSNKIVIPQSKDRKKKEFDLVISINPEYVSTGVEEENADISAANKPILTPNPEVAGLIGGTGERSAERNSIDEKPDSEKTVEEILYEKLEKKNPYKLFRKVYQRNLTQAIIGAVIIYLITITIFSTYAANQKTPQVEPNPQRLVIIQDMPEPKINLENVEDPNAPPPEEETEGDDGLIPRKIPRTTSPRIYRPRTEDNTPNVTDTALVNQQRRLDSLRNLAEGDSLNKKDSILATNNSIDSNSISQSVSDIGLSINFPAGWGMTDTRSVTTELKEFAAVYLADSNAKPRGAVVVYIYLDNRGERYTTGTFTDNFPVNDTSLTVYSAKPINQTTENEVIMQYYVFGTTDKLYVNAKINADQVDKYKPIIEGIIRSIRLKRPGT